MQRRGKFVCMCVSVEFTRCLKVVLKDLPFLATDYGAFSNTFQFDILFY